VSAEVAAVKAKNRSEIPVKRFLIFSLSRSGSSTLKEMLECHPQVRCAFEPFNPSTKLGRKYGFQIDDEATLEQCAAKVWEAFNGIKHVWNCNGVPFGSQDERQRLNDHLLTISRAKVIFLKRRNILKRIVSGEISHQSGIWASDTRARRKIRGSQFEPLDISWLRWQLERELGAVARVRECLLTSRIPFLDLWYEDLYGEFDPPDGSALKLQEIFSFLGLPALDRRKSKQIERLLDPLYRRVNSRASYELIPNIEEVENQLGADATGWLFQ